MKTNSIESMPVRRLCQLLICWCFLLIYGSSQAQVSPSVPATTANHNKQVIGYITQWDAWKNIAGIVPQGGYNHLNVDYSQYTILNFSFFGVAKDGSLHSGDYRNKNIWQKGAVQEPAPLLYEDIYSSWDKYLIYGELDILYNIVDNSYAYQLGYRNDGAGWKNINTGKTGSFPLAAPKQGGAPGLLDLAHQKGVKVLASIGGWSMCKHYPEMAADPVKRARFLAGCKELIDMGFDGIDFDWEYPNDPGMNIEHYGTADYANFAALAEAVRTQIGPNKLLTTCFSASATKLTGFDWARLNRSFDYFNMMTYDFNGGWSNKAGHNSPLYDVPGQEYPNFSINSLYQSIKQLPGMNLSKVNMGAPFYGRGVITTGPAQLHGGTTKRPETVQPDGPISTCADYTNWTKDVFDGTPYYSYILSVTGANSGWTEYWDDVAKVPYKTKGNYFLSYDNERSIGEKAKFVKDNNLAGIIVWQVYGDMVNMTSSTVPKGKLIYCPNTRHPLVNKINEVFAGGSTGNKPPVVNITAPANNATFTAPANINITATATDSDGTIAYVEFYNGATRLATDSTAPYSFAWNNVAAGTYSITAKATDNQGASATSAAISLTVNGTGGNTPPTVSITAPANNATFSAPATVNITANAADANGRVVRVEFYNGTTRLATDSTAPYSYTWSNVAAGTYSITAKATDNDNATTTSAAVSITVNGTSGGNCAGIAAYQPYPKIYNQGEKVTYNNNLYECLVNNLYNVTPGSADWWWKPLGPCSGTAARATQAGDTNGKLIVGYWHNWGNTTQVPKYIRLRDVNAKYNVINVAFPTSGPDFATMLFTPENITEAEFKSDIAFLQSQGKKVLLSLGGQNGTVTLNTAAQKTAFVNSMKGLLDQYNFDGFDIDLEGGASLQLDNNDKNFMAPTTPKVVNMIAAVKELLAYRKGQGKNGWLTMAPETYYVHTAYGATYAPLVGAYLPLIYGLRNELTVIYPQYYNTGSVTGLDNKNYNQGTSDFIVAMTDMLLQGFPVAGTNQTFPALREDQVAFGLPATQGAAGGGYTAPANVTKALNYLVKGISYGGAYTLRKAGGYPGLRGIMTWSVNWDISNNNEFANNAYEFFYGGGSTGNPPAVNITAPANNAAFNAPANINLTANASDSDGSVTKVEFFNGGSKLGEDPTAPYSFAWNSVAAGSYTITARATDNQGNVTTSAPVTISVNGSGSAPVVNITAPANNASFTAPANINITANASDSDGSVTKVEFFNGSAKLGEDPTAPYSFAWNNVGAGTYSITAKATDNQGNTTTSAAVSITVNGTGGSNCAGIPAYQPYPKIYNQGDKVVYNNNLYESQSNNLYNVTPGTADWWWKPLGPCSGSFARTDSRPTVGEEENTNDQLNVYPNPVTGTEVRLQVKARPGEQLVLELTDLKGGRLQQRQVQTATVKGEQPVRLDVSKLPAGTWIIKVTGDKNRKVGTAKIIKL
ncbi:Ig-like domain-containing protein [Chitinophaga sp. MD30]|uniref:Ig-like domain-containing protein n=1 Tax=Chitinophaga sp. MD30 TaxID=2033437 RepID=UPI000BAE9E6B|nr:Ig-like domain-containing protein [Chitinophaga sp. MD30]ASZ11129.1 hypothetical protein CK934_09220 [Chitinophaga sp. MD30]